LLLIKDNELIIYADEPGDIYTELQKESGHSATDISPHIAIESRLTQQQYIEAVQRIQHHIQIGDCYELNFCQEFFATGVAVNPAIVYQRLHTISPNPFSAFYRLHDKYLICASPERFLTKHDNILLSQPIKGTAKRSSDKDIDNKLQEELYYSSKERSENVMVVDLVRNDLSKVCKEGSVRVDELYGIYSFPQVHQMISTISGELKKDISFTDIIKATFPMGSMTGAPKKKVMELIAQYEVANRGIFSGSVGYMDNNKNFDFNVVIRSLMYNSTNQYLSYQVGSGITFYSDAEKEWEECLLKAEAIKRVLNHDLPD
jgi:para-aminobenzoate synthetase component 1